MPRCLARWVAVSLALIVAAAACNSNDEDATGVAPGAAGQQTSVASTELTPTAEANPTASADATSAVDREPLTITTASGIRVELFAELAITPDERARGLMGRTELEPDSGMLFAIQPPGRGFWMKDTPIALTIAFIAACGEIVDLIDMEPLSEEVKNASHPYAFALEMEQGWFAENGIAVGDEVELPAELLPAEC